MDKAIDIGEFSIAIAGMLKDYKYQVDETTKKVVREVAKESALVVKQHVPSNWSAEYKKQISATTPTVRRGNFVSYVHMNGKKYRIAHLLENGHALVRGGRSVGKGQTEAFPHFRYGEDYAESELGKRLQEEL